MMDDVKARNAEGAETTLSAGDPGDTFALGARALLGDGVPQATQSGAALIRQAADAGFAPAITAMATLTAAGGVIDQSWPLAFDLLQTAAECGCPRAQRQLQLLAGWSGADAADGSDDWKALRSAIDFARLIAPPQKIILHQAPRVRAVQKICPGAVCDWIIDGARGRLKRGLMYDGAARKAVWKASRTCQEYAFDILTSDVVMLVLRARIAVLVSLPTGAMEPPQVFHYAVGEEIKPHFDHMSRGSGHGRDGAFYSERIVSFLLYLNDDFVGGELEFPQVGLKHKGAKGDGVFFANVDLQGQPDPLSLHAGLVVVSGEKWLLSQWIHDRPFEAVL